MVNPNVVIDSEDCILLGHQKLKRKYGKDYLERLREFAASGDDRLEGAEYFSNINYNPSRKLGNNFAVFKFSKSTLSEQIRIQLKNIFK